MKTIIAVVSFVLVGAGYSSFVGLKLKLTEAQTIMGEACVLTEDSTIQIEGGLKNEMTFITKASESNKDKPNALYYLFTSYNAEKLAQDRFKDVFQSNKDHQGFEKVNDLGDEALYHSDNANFMLIMARKKNNIVAIKVNKISTKSSRQELKRVTGELLKKI